MHAPTLQHLFVFSLFLVGSHTAPNGPGRPNSPDRHHPSGALAAPPTALPAPPPTRLVARDPRGYGGGNQWGGGEGGMGDFVMLQSACAGVIGPLTTDSSFSLKANLPPGGRGGGGSVSGGGAGPSSVFGAGASSVVDAGASSIASAPTSQASVAGSKMIRREPDGVVLDKRAPEPQQSQVSPGPGQIPQDVLLKICPHIMAFTAKDNAAPVAKAPPVSNVPQVSNVSQVSNIPPVTNTVGPGAPIQTGLPTAVQSVPTAQST